MTPEELPAPPFLKPEALATLLEWPPRHLRLFREIVGKRSAEAWLEDDGTPEGFYKSLSHYLARPAGLASFEALIGGVDKRQRGLVTKLFERARATADLAGEDTAPPRSGWLEVVDFVNSLCNAECWEEAAWIAWARLACVTEPK